MSNHQISSYLSGVTWGSLANGRLIGPLYAHDEIDQYNYKTMGALFAAVSIPLSTPVVNSPWVRLSVSALFATVYTLSENVNRTTKHIYRRDFSGWQKVVLPIVRIYKRYEDQIFLGLNLITSAVEIAKGERTYPLTKLAITAVVYAHRKWVHESEVKKEFIGFSTKWVIENDRITQIGLIALTALALIQPVRGVVTGLCLFGSKMGALGSKIVSLYKAHPYIYWPLTALFILQATRQSRGIR